MSQRQPFNPFLLLPPGVLLSGALLLSACAPPVATPSLPAPATTPAPQSTPTTAPTASAPPTEPPPTPTPSPTDTAEWQSYSGQGFRLEYPADWAFVGPNGIECAAIYHFFPSTIKLITFSACWEDHVGGDTLTFEETYERFREAFVADAHVSERTINGLEVEVIQYASSGNNWIYVLDAPSGTLALWRRGNTGWALIDEGDLYQQNGIFDRILASFRFSEEGD